MVAGRAQRVRGVVTSWPVLALLLALAACRAEPLPARLQFLDQRPDASADAQLADVATDAGHDAADTPTPVADVVAEVTDSTDDVAIDVADDATIGADIGTDIEGPDAADVADAADAADAEPDAGCPSSEPGLCNDGNPCTEDTCVNGACSHAALTSPCSDGNACTVGDVCAGGVCVPGKVVPCEDNNACTDDACQPGSGCTNLAVPGPCDDGDPCESSDFCKNGKCSAGAVLLCEDDNVCTTDVCAAGACTHDALAGPCDDKDVCTLGDACLDGVCLAGAPTACEDGNVCTQGACDPALGCAQLPSDGTVCDDGNACTVLDVCAASACSPGAAPECDDGAVCTDDSCAPATGCVHLANAATCSDGQVCTTGDACSGGQCAPGPPPDCQDGNACTADSCVPVSGCVHLPIIATCSDGNGCTTNDMCGAGGVCQAGAKLDCNDNNPCTADGCDSLALCQHTPVAAPCDDGDVCTATDACDGGVCKGGNGKDCDDKNACTKDSCAGNVCFHASTGQKCGNDGSSKAAPGLDCLDIKNAYPALPDGVYWIDPTGGAPDDAFQAACNMTRDGGGWTLGVKHWYLSGGGGIVGTSGTIADALAVQGNPYKLADQSISDIIGPGGAYDVMFDTAGFNSLYSTGNHEYVLLRNYTAKWTWATFVPASSTPTLIQSFRIADNALAWQGNMACGYPGARGINCVTLTLGTNPAGGMGCAINMGKASNVGWHHLFMANTNSDTYTYFCNGAQHSSSQAMNHRYWFRKAQPWAGVPGPDGKFVTSGLAKDCLAIKKANAKAADGSYWIDPNGGSATDAYAVQCNMTRQGGGWTLGVKHWHQDTSAGMATGINGAAEAMSVQGNPYKLSDADIKLITGPSFDVMVDQTGWNTWYSTGNFEYLVLRNYTAAWTWAAKVAESSTPTSVQSYRSSDHALAWTGQYKCGNVGGYGINCVTLAAGVAPGGGLGCAIAMSATVAAVWQDFYMADTNTDSRFYVCNGAQHSSSMAMNHRYWFREAQPWGVPDPSGQPVSSGLPTSCDDIQSAIPTSASGFYWIDPNGGSVADAFQVQCDMARDGGGWTLGIKHWYLSGLTGNVAAFAGTSQVGAIKTHPYKLSDADINTIAGPTYDVLFDQNGFIPGQSASNNEYAVLRNYTAPFKFSGVTPASSTLTSVQSYRLYDNVLAWTGNLKCGAIGGWGINCGELLSGKSPAGGSGCLINMGTNWNETWHHLYMAQYNTDTYLYLCSSVQASSLGAMNHRYWFRKTKTKL